MEFVDVWPFLKLLEKVTCWWNFPQDWGNLPALLHRVTDVAMDVGSRAIFGCWGAFFVDLTGEKSLSLIKMDEEVMSPWDCFKKIGVHIYIDHIQCISLRKDRCEITWTAFSGVVNILIYRTCFFDEGILMKGRCYNSQCFNKVSCRVLEGRG